MPEHVPLRPCGVCMRPFPDGNCPTHPKRSYGRQQRAGARAYNGPWRRIRDRAVAAAGGRCAYCDGPASTGDHVLPRSRGGLTEQRNTVCCCSGCNTSKGDRTLAEWIASGTAAQYAASVLHSRARLGLPV